MTRWAIVADLNRCVGCQTCTAACKQANSTAPGVQWRKVLDFETGEFPDVSRTFVPVGCMHCDDPPCLDVCPSTATRKRDDGIVTIDYDVCIGCSYCAVACPYQARYRVDTPNEAYGVDLPMDHEVVRENWDRRAVAQKCTLCIHRIDPGLANGKTPGVDPEATPACVNSCIAGALEMGDLDDENSNVSRLLKENRHFRMHEELGTGPGFYYLYDRDIDDPTPLAAPPMVADPAGLAAVSSKLQTQWDWRAAANFILGGAGTGLFAASVVGGLAAPVLLPAVLLALLLVGAGLFCVWLEIGRPWRFANAYRNARTSWMTREAMAVMPYFAFGGLFLLWPNLPAGLIAAASGLVFLYCQGRILHAAKGIPAWRQREIVPLIVATGLSEGAGLLAALAVLAGYFLPMLGPVLIALVLVRYALWHRYRSALGTTGAPAETFRALDAGQFNLGITSQLAVVAFLIVGLFFPTVLALGGLLAVLTGWAFKYTLITKAAYNQGFAINRVPARGAGKSKPGIKPGWTMS